MSAEPDDGYDGGGTAQVRSVSSRTGAAYSRDPEPVTTGSQRAEWVVAASPSSHSRRYRLTEAHDRGRRATEMTRRDGTP